MQNITERINYILENVIGCNKSNLSRQLGYASPSFLYNILNGRMPVNLKFVDKLVAQYPYINKNWIITGEGEPVIKELEISVDGKNLKEIANEIHKYSSYLNSNPNDKKKELETLDLLSNILKSTSLAKNSSIELLIKMQEQQISTDENIKRTIEQLGKLDDRIDKVLRILEARKELVLANDLEFTNTN